MSRESARSQSLTMWGLCLVISLALFVVSTRAWAGAVFLTGHDPDFHAAAGDNSVGAQHLNHVAITFITDPASNPYSAGGVHKFLFVESRMPVPGGHIDGKNGVIISGYTEGVDFDTADATVLNAAISQLGSSYCAIVVASDFGGILTQAELDVLNARATDIAAFVNSGGGLYAMAESNGGAHLTPDGRRFAFIPSVISSTQFDQTESGFTVTSFGASLGLTAGDVNGNYSHNIFTTTGGLNVVDRDAAGHVLSLAGNVTIGGGCHPGRGDVNASGEITVADAPALVAVLLGNDQDMDHLARADTNCDGRNDGDDIQPFLALLLGP